MIYAQSHVDVATFGVIQTYHGRSIHDTYLLERCI